MMAHLPQGQLCSNEQIEELVSATPGPVGPDAVGPDALGRRRWTADGRVNLCCNQRISRESKYHLTKQQSVTTKVNVGQLS